MSFWDRVGDRVIGVLEQAEVIRLRRCLDALHTSLDGWFGESRPERSAPSVSDERSPGEQVNPLLQAVVFYHADESDKDVDSAVLRPLSVAVNDVLRTLPERGCLVDLTDADVLAWFRALADVRIALALSVYDADTDADGVRGMLQCLAGLERGLRSVREPCRSRVPLHLVRSINQLSW